MGTQDPCRITHGSYGLYLLLHRDPCHGLLLHRDPFTIMFFTASFLNNQTRWNDQSRTGSEHLTGHDEDWPILQQQWNMVTCYVLHLDVRSGLNSHYFHIVGDGHQPNSRGLYTHYKDSLLKVGWPSPIYGAENRITPNRTCWNAWDQIGKGWHQAYQARLAPDFFCELEIDTRIYTIY